MFVGELFCVNIITQSLYSKSKDAVFNITQVGELFCVNIITQSLYSKSKDAVFNITQNSLRFSQWLNFLNV